MSTVFNIRQMKLPTVSRWAIVIGAIVVIMALVAGYFGLQLYKQLTRNTVVAYFTEANALYVGDKVQIMGVQVGKIDAIEPNETGDLMKVTFHYDNKYKVPADAQAVILNPSLVASRTIQLVPAYSGGEALQDGAEIPPERTQVPVEWDDLRNQITDIVGELGPTEAQPDGPFGDVLNAFADGLEGKGDLINTTLNNLSTSLTALSEGRGDFFGVVRSLKLFVTALYQDDQRYVALNNNLASFTNGLTQSDQEVAATIAQLDSVLRATQDLLAENRGVLTADINNLAEVTNAILQPVPRDGLETALHVLPNLAANLAAIYEPAHGALTILPVINNFANPMEFICSSIQSASRLGYQESAELCAQYLGPIFDAIKFNYPPFSASLFNGADTLPGMVAYSEERLRPPPGYKDTTVPGVWARDTLFSHGNHEPGWLIAPGMDGLELQQFTQNMLAPESLAGLLGAPIPAGVTPAPAEPPLAAEVPAPGAPVPATPVESAPLGAAEEPGPEQLPLGPGQ
ncbi:MAG: virulence factor Mce family protein [Mycobacterium sp.]